MLNEGFKPYSERVVTVVGGRGALGSKIASTFETLGFQGVQICEQGDPFSDLVSSSTDIFFAVDNKTIEEMIRDNWRVFSPGQTILDGSSVKAPLIPLYEELDKAGISVSSTHLGSVPTHPWRGTKVWVCEVGPNSKRARRLAFDLFLSANSSIRAIDIREHKYVEIDQWITMFTNHIFARVLRSLGFPLREFDRFATLNSELSGLSVGRTLGQGTNVPSEVLYNQPAKLSLEDTFEDAIREFRLALSDREDLQTLMNENIAFHNQDGFVEEIFRRAGIIGARNANLRMYSLSFRITDDEPGLLRSLLSPFDIEGANLTAIDSMAGIATKEELARGVNPDKIVDFDIGVDPKTIDPEKEQRIRSSLIELGCTII